MQETQNKSFLQQFLQGFYSSTNTKFAHSLGARSFHTTIRASQLNILDIFHEILLLQSSIGLEPKPEGRVAICLVGGARAFELTGETIKKYLLSTYNNTDVFLHAPLDEDAYKFWRLKKEEEFGIAGGSNNYRFATARIFTQSKLLESHLENEVLSPKSSPSGIQGLLQYFALVEGCLEMISKYAAKNDIDYKWVIRTRVDGFWNGIPPPLSSFQPHSYYVPVGSQYGGLNDRFGLGNWNTSTVALARRSLLPALHARGRRLMNSETAFKAQLVEFGVPFQRVQLPFCVLSRRSYGWPLSSSRDVPVASIATSGALSGAKCRPCATAAAADAPAQAMVSGLDRSWGWPGSNNISGLRLCDARGNWEQQAVEREGPVNTTFACEKLVQEFMLQWSVWDAPSPQEICSHSKVHR
jgi:hypothetical protein